MKVTILLLTTDLIIIANVILIFNCCCGHEVYNCRYQLTGIC